MPFYISNNSSLRQSNCGYWYFIGIISILLIDGHALWNSKNNIWLPNWLLHHENSHVMWKFPLNSVRQLSVKINSSNESMVLWIISKFKNKGAFISGVIRYFGAKWDLKKKISYYIHNLWYKLYINKLVFFFFLNLFAKRAYIYTFVSHSSHSKIYHQIIFLNTLRRMKIWLRNAMNDNILISRAMINIRSIWRQRQFNFKARIINS